MIQIIPSILVSSEKEFKTQINSLKNAVKMVQIDLADGQFVPNITWAYQNPQTAQKYLNEINFELHLMVNDPLIVIKNWSTHSNLKKILVHFESISNPTTILSELKKTNKKIGLVLKPETSLSEIEPFLNQVNTIMFMGVHPGFQGQKLIPKVLEKIKEFKSKHHNHFTEIDGAVNMETISQIIKTGVDAICPGSAIFGNTNDPKKNIEAIKKEIQRLTAVA